ncbi:variable surface protein [Plasmodium gonderi]|uniref:Variable surface protein n=1 Tax=Plasmodium gonderi TaxID=77519 RepID=A0A1Y1JWF6_PLAGO|nr:variable surface protein [Plasmodium gonderi]GAW84673.1 variable surface protein [Plasmodium gonderi]
MKKNIYAFVEYFPKWKRAIDTHKNNINQTLINICIEKSNFKSKISTFSEICTQAMPYNFEIHNRGSNTLDEAACIYLFYWLYKYHLMNGNNDYDFKNIYKELISIYNNINTDINISTDYEKNVNDDDLKKIAVTYDFTPYGSRIYHKIKGEKKKWNNMHEENDILKISELSKCNNRNTNYEIVYNFI